jgi:16S rRNA processing protein RimM
MRKRPPAENMTGAADKGARADSTESLPPALDGERVLLGRIVAAHGLRGEVKILTFTEAPDNIAAYGPLSDGRGRDFRIDHLRHLKGEAVIARLVGVADRAAAEKLRGTELYVSRDCLPLAEEEEWYYSDLVGLQAMTPDGQTFGEVVSVQNFGAGDLLELRRDGERQTVFLAFTHKNVPTVDIKSGRVIVVPPEEIIASPDQEKIDPMT